MAVPGLRPPQEDIRATPKRSHRLPHGEGSFYFGEIKQLWVGVIEAGWTERHPSPRDRYVEG